MRALDIRVTQGMATRIETEWGATWFGTLVLIVVEAGRVTPPLSTNLITNAMAWQISMVQTCRAEMWRVTSDTLRVILRVPFPSIALFLLYSPGSRPDKGAKGPNRYEG